MKKAFTAKICTHFETKSYVLDKVWPKDMFFLIFSDEAGTRNLLIFYTVILTRKVVLQSFIMSERCRYLCYYVLHICVHGATSKHCTNKSNFQSIDKIISAENFFGILQKFANIKPYHVSLTLLWLW